MGLEMCIRDRDTPERTPTAHCHQAYSTASRSPTPFAVSIKYPPLGRHRAPCLPRTDRLSLGMTPSVMNTLEMIVGTVVVGAFVVYKMHERPQQSVPREGTAHQQ